MTFSKQGELVQFLSAGDAKINSCKVYFSPKQAGTGDPSPENVREISGYDGVEVYHCGKNLIKFDNPDNPTENYYHNSTGTTAYSKKENAFYSSGAGVAYTAHAKKSGTDSRLFIAPNDMKITLSLEYKNVSTSYGLRFYVKGTRVTDIHGSADSTWHKYTYTTTLNKGDTIYLMCYGGIFWRNIQIEINSTATSYEPYETRISLPGEYQEVEYIESPKTQYAYINTEVPITEDVRFVIDFQSVTNSTGGYLMGGYSGTHFYLYKGASGYFQTAFGCSWKNTSLKYDAKRHIFDYSFTDGYLNVVGDGNVILTTLDTDLSTHPTIKIAGTSSANAAKNVSRTFSSKIFRNNELIQNLIPCYRKSDNKPGMYDTVSSTFLTNQGTGEFLIGPKINGYDIDWSSEVGTVYGGYVDLVSGELVEEWKYLELNGTETWTKNSGTQYSTDGSYRFVTSVPKSYWVGINKPIEYGMANYLKPRNTGGLYYEYPNNFGIYQTRYYVRISGISEVADLKTYLASNVLQTTYKLATPITHQLTPSQLTTLTNQNTFWSNADRIEIEYDLIETRQIEMERRNIIMNSPHVESVTGSNASFITDVVSNLKECKVYFTPIQEGSGDPSPENVSPIVGWDGVTVYKNGAEDFYNYSNVTALNSASVTKINDKSFRLHALNRKYPASKQPTSSLSLTIGKRYIISFDITIDSMASGHICAFGFRNTANTFQTDGRVNISESGHYILDFVYDSNANKNYLSLCETSGASVTFDATISNLCIYEILEITIPFPKTIYGGYVDLVKGEVVEEWEKITLDGVTTNRKVNRDYTNTASLACGVVYLNPSGKEDNQRVTKLLCENMTIVAQSQTAEYPYIRTISSGSQYLRIFMGPIGDYPDLDTARKRIDYINSYLSENPTSVCYPLRNPTTYSLTPQAIKALRGINTIWSDANGNITVSYFTH